jgi:outer membrane receptor protein involved in Fe transport
LMDEWSVFSAASINDVRNRQTKQIVKGDTGISRESFKWGASYTSSHGLTVSLQGAYNRWSSSPGDANDRKPIFDAHLSQQFPHLFPHVDLEIFLNIYNITNSQYWSDPVFPLAGRRFEGGASLSF